MPENILYCTTVLIIRRWQPVGLHFLSLLLADEEYDQWSVMPLEAPVKSGKMQAFIRCNSSRFSLSSATHPADMTPAQPDPWDFLQTHTAARIALGRAGQSLPTHQLLRFQLAHAQARDAVYSELDTDRLAREIQMLGLAALTVQSRAATRTEYVRRPDFGRQLSDNARKALAKYIPSDAPADLCIVLADGLSARAVQSHAVPLLAAALPQFTHAGFTLSPVVIAQGGRVAIGDQIGYLLGTSLVAVLIGERPGLSAPNSLGIYLTYGPHPGLTDESRNCISNVRPEGLPYEMAALKLCYLLHEMRTRKLSGVGLKDEQLPGQLPQEAVGGRPAF